MLAGLDGQETDKGNLHAGQCSQCIPTGIRNVKPSAVAAHADENKGVKRKETGDEGITTPGSNHVTVKEGAKSSPEHGSELQSLNPQVEGEDQKENGNGFVVVAASNRARDVAGGNAHEDGGKETGRRRRGHLVGEEVSGVGSKT